MKLQLRMKVLLTALAAAVLASSLLAGSASATLVKEFVKFQACPFENPEVKKCLWSNTESGSVTLGNKTVPITNDTLLQGGFGAVNTETKFAKFIGTTGGAPILVPTPQPVPGGLAGLINCKEIKDFILRAACEWTFENGLTGLDSTLELAGTAADMQISETNMARKEGVALEMPVKVRLENPFLGSNCYVGSNSNPIVWKLTSGTTSPPEGVEPLTGNAGKIQALEGGRILQLNGNVLVDNTWSAPGTKGCGGLFAFLLDPIISLAAGLPAGPGVNAATLENTVATSTAVAVKKVNDENP